MQNPRNEQVERMVVLEANDAANVVPVLPNGAILFVKQFRFGTKQVTIELPGGIVDPGEEHETAVKRELLEETGYKASTWAHLGTLPSNPVFMDNYIHHWVAEGVEWSQELDLDDGELVEPLIFSEAEVLEKLRSGGFQHTHTVSALVLYFAKKGFF